MLKIIALLLVYSVLSWAAWWSGYAQGHTAACSGGSVQPPAHHDKSGIATFDSLGRIVIDGKLQLQPQGETK